MSKLLTREQLQLVAADAGEIERALLHDIERLTACLEFIVESAGKPTDGNADYLHAALDEAEELLTHGEAASLEGRLAYNAGVKS